MRRSKIIVHYCFVVILLTLFPLACGQAPPKAVPVDTTPEQSPMRGSQMDGPFTLSQDLGANYTPNTEHAASVTMTYAGSAPVTALALRIKLPMGWTFGTIKEGAKPAIVPAVGTTDVVTLVWIQAPKFPATLRYTLAIPEWAEGARTLEAQAIYRTLGGELHSPIHRVEATNAS